MQFSFVSYILIKLGEGARQIFKQKASSVPKAPSISGTWLSSPPPLKELYEVQTQVFKLPSPLNSWKKGKEKWGKVRDDGGKNSAKAETQTNKCK